MFKGKLCDQGDQLGLNRIFSNKDFIWDIFLEERRCDPRSNMVTVGAKNCLANCQEPLDSRKSRGEDYLPGISGAGPGSSNLTRPEPIWAYIGIWISNMAVNNGVRKTYWTKKGSWISVLVAPMVGYP